MSEREARFRKGSRDRNMKTGLKSAVPTFNSCTKCADSPDIIHDRTSDCHPVLDTHHQPLVSWDEIKYSQLFLISDGILWDCLSYWLLQHTELWAMRHTNKPPTC